METVRTLEVAPAPAADESPLAHARLHRQLTVDWAVLTHNLWVLARLPKRKSKKAAPPQRLAA